MELISIRKAYEVAYCFCTNAFGITSHVFL